MATFAGPPWPGPVTKIASRSRDLDRSVQVRVDEIEAGHGAEVAEQPRLHVLRLQRLAQERVVEQVDLPDREVVRGSPVGVEKLDFLLRQDVR